jgi:hypothetical protein
MFYDNEIDKMDMEYRASEIKVQNYINGFANDIKKIDKKDLVGGTSIPIKMKIPFKVKIKRFFEKLNKVLN